MQSGPQRLVPDLHVCKPDPWNGIRTPLYGVRVTHSGVPRSQDGTYTGLGQDPVKGSGADTCPGPAWCGPVRITLLLPAQAET